MARSRKNLESIVITSWNILHGQLIPPNPQNSTNSPQKSKQLLTSAGQKLQQSFLSSGTGRGKGSVIALQECDFNQPRSAKLNQVQLIGQGAKLKNWFFVPTLIGTPGENWKKIKQPIVLSNSNLDLNVGSNIGSNLDLKNLRKNNLYGIGFATDLKVKQVHIKKLGRSLIGLPLLFPADKGGKNRVQLIYVKDEPRIALALELENGLTIINTHLSFVPFVNWFQLHRISRWAKKLPGEKVLLGDLNLPANLPSKLSRWQSQVDQKTYPAWKPGIQFDYIMTRRAKIQKIFTNFQALAIIKLSDLKISDHIPISAKVEFKPRST